jgi:hypothetical protein
MTKKMLKEAPKKMLLCILLSATLVSQAHALTATDKGSLLVPSGAYDIVALGVKGDILLVATGAGLLIVDVTDAANPVAVYSRPIPGRCCFYDEVWRYCLCRYRTERSIDP